MTDRLHVPDAPAATAEAPALPSWLILTAFAACASVVYLAILSRGTFSLAGPESFDGAYAAYARAILSGHLDVSRDVIGNEGFYVDGKVYLYYGILPALERIPFLLVGTEWLPSPRTFVFVEAVATALLFHLTTAHVLSAGKISSARQSTVVFAGLMSWFASPSLLLASNASIYTEPFANALMLFALTIYLLRKSIVTAAAGRVPRLSGVRLAGIALLGALCLHARVPMAIALLLLGATLCIWTLFEPDPDATPTARVQRFVRRGPVPALLVGLSVFALLMLNKEKFGDPLSFGPLKYYGYYLFVEGHSARMTAFFEHGRFELMRIVPNFIANFLGTALGHEFLTRSLGTGQIRLEGPLTGVIVMWLVECLYAVHAVRRLMAERKDALASVLWRASIVTALSSSCLLILTYGTVALRYKLEIWPFIFALALLGLASGGSAGPGTAGTDQEVRPNRVDAGRAWVFLLISIVFCSFATYALKQNPLFNGDTRSAYIVRTTNADPASPIR